VTCHLDQEARDRGLDLPELVDTLYTIILSVPANTARFRLIRIATTERRQLSVFTPGVYSEPGGRNQYDTGPEPVRVLITGKRPTDTRCVNPSDAPRTPDR
jgi:hypothetical protein